MYIWDMKCICGIVEVVGSNPLGASDFFLGFICNCLSYFTTMKISFTSISGTDRTFCDGGTGF